MKFKKSFMLHFLTYRFFYIGYLLVSSLLILFSTSIISNEQVIPNYIYIFIAITTIQTFIIAYYENFRLSAIYLNINGDRITWLISSVIFGILNCIINLLLLFLLNFLFNKYSAIPLFPQSDIFIYLFISSIYTLIYSLSSLLGIVKTHKKITFKIFLTTVLILLIVLFPFVTTIMLDWKIFLFQPGINYLLISIIFYVLALFLYSVYYLKIIKMNI